MAHRSFDAKVGRLVLAPFRLAVLLVVFLIALVLLPILYIPGAIYFFILAKNEGENLRTCLFQAVAWPLVVAVNILAMNEFPSLGGFDIPFLTRFTDWLQKRN